MKIKIVIPSGSRVFLLEDDEVRIKWFLERLPGAVIATEPDEAKAILDANPPFDFVFLDHDLGLRDYHGAGIEGNGQHVARYLAERGETGLNTVVHSWNPVGASAIKTILPNATVIPFGQFEFAIES
jgi:hypothetical protein